MLLHVRSAGDAPQTLGMHFPLPPPAQLGRVWVKLGARRALWSAKKPALRNVLKMKAEDCMPVMKREDWIKLSPTEKVVHRARRLFDRTEQAQARCDR